MTTTGRDLPEYLDHLRARPAEMVVVERPVHPGPEMMSVVKGLEPLGAPAVVFEQVHGWPHRVVMGLFGSRARLAEAFGGTRASLLQRAVGVTGEELPASTPLQDAPVQEVVLRGDQVDLSAFPFAVHSRDDAAPYITAGVLVVRDPTTGRINTGIYRLMLGGNDWVSVNAAPDHDLGRILAAATTAGEQLEVAVVIGHHPAYLVGSQLKHDTTVDSHEVTGALLGAPLEVTPGVSVDLPVPARAEIVLEGVVDPAQRVEEGPFGEFTYYYGHTTAPVCRITAITHKRAPIFHDLHPTHREHLCLWLFPGREARLLSRLQAVVPGVRDVRIPFHSGGLSAYVTIAKTHQGEGKQAVLAALAADHFLKHVIVVDDDVDIFDDTRVLWSAQVRVQPDRDILTVSGARGIKMDPSADVVEVAGKPQHVTSKQGVDATRPLHPAFPSAADLPHTGFDAIDVFDYLEGRDAETMAARTAARLALDE